VVIVVIVVAPLGAQTAAGRQPFTQFRRSQSRRGSASIRPTAGAANAWV
jgi:hypothetical protein